MKNYNHFKIVLLILFSFTIIAGPKNIGFGFSGIQVNKQQLRFSTFNSSGNKDQELLLDPNPKRNLTLEYHHKKFSFFIGLPIIGEDERVKGKSESFDFRFKNKINNFLPKLYYQKYKGFELRDELNDSTTIGFLGNTQTLNYGLGISVYFTDDFVSYHSGYSFFKKLKMKNLKKSKLIGSYLFNIGYNYLKIKGLPLSGQALNSFIGESKYQNLTANFGGTSQYRKGPFLFEGTLALGLGLNRSSTNSFQRKTNILMNGDVEAVFAFHFYEKYFFLTRFDIHFISGRIEGTELNNSMLSLNISVGRAF